MKTESQETMVSGKHFHLTVLILHQSDRDNLKETKNQISDQMSSESEASVGLFLQS